MIFVKQFALYFIVFVSSFFICFLGAYGFIFFDANGTPIDLLFKFQRENVLYFSFLFTMIMHLIYFYLVRHSKNVFKELDKIIDLALAGNANIKEYLKKLGTLGKKINYLFFHLTDLNEKRAVKISALSRLVMQLVDASTNPCIVVFRDGSIVCVSKSLAQFASGNTSSFKGIGIDTFMPEINFSDIAFNLERTNKEILQENVCVNVDNNQMFYSATYHPVLNVDNKLSYIIVDFSF